MPNARDVLRERLWSLLPLQSANERSMTYCLGQQ